MITALTGLIWTVWAKQGIAENGRGIKKNEQAIATVQKDVRGVITTQAHHSDQLKNIQSAQVDHLNAIGWVQQGVTRLRETQTVHGNKLQNIEDSIKRLQDQLNQSTDIFDSTIKQTQEEIEKKIDLLGAELRESSSDSARQSLQKLQTFQECLKTLHEKMDTQNSDLIDRMSSLEDTIERNAKTFREAFRRDLQQCLSSVGQREQSSPVIPYHRMLSGSGKMSLTSGYLFTLHINGRGIPQPQIMPGPSDFSHMEEVE